MSGNPHASDHGGYGSSASCLMTLAKITLSLAAVAAGFGVLVFGAVLNGPKTVGEVYEP